ncbi:MAG: LysE family translocator [Alphaproteobacteria bacterium]|nr:LysE family translocator [Alphaproteobacteria bacterium]
MTLDAWVSFAILWFLLGLPVGPNAIVTMTTSARDGLRAGLLTATGITLAGALHGTFALTGVGALLSAVPDALTILKWLGGAYLALIGIRLWRRGGRPVDPPSGSTPRIRSHVARGMLVSLSNPQAILTYLAVFPIVINANAPLAPQLMVLFPTALGIVFANYTMYALFGAQVAHLLSSARRRCWFDRGAGGLMVGSAVALTISGRS